MRPSVAVTSSLCDARRMVERGSGGRHEKRAGTRWRWLVPLSVLACFTPDENEPGDGGSSSGTLGTTVSASDSADDDSTVTDDADATAVDTTQDDDASTGGCPPAVFGQTRFGESCFSR